MNPYHDSPLGIHLLVKVIPKSSRNEIGKVENGRLKIKITVAPEKGKANDAVIDMLSEAFCIPKSKVVLLQGEKNPSKTFLLEGVSAQDFEIFFTRICAGAKKKLDKK